jgi:hypothetical protein
MQQVITGSFQIPTRHLLFPENQRFKNKMIDYAHHCISTTKKRTAANTWKISGHAKTLFRFV